MSIELHCPQCRKQIKAPDNAGGKNGKCPYCGTSVYIPMPPDEGEAIGLAPVDEAEESQAAALRRESTELAAQIGHAKESVEETSAAEKPGAVEAEADAPFDLSAELEAFVLAMHESRLEEAEAAANRIKGLGRKARIEIKTMVNKNDAPRIQDVPPPLVLGFLGDLFNRIR